MQRFLFSEYGQGKKPLPKKLEFLKSFKVHAIVRYSKDGQIKYRLELPSPQIKRLLDKLVLIKQLEKEKTHLINQLEIEKTKLETENKELLKEIETLNSRCELLRYELSDKIKAKQNKKNLMPPVVEKRVHHRFLINFHNIH